MSIPKPMQPKVAPKRAHYFDPAPVVASRPRTVRLQLPYLSVELESDRGVFGAHRVDLGTVVLLKEAPPPPLAGEVLDLGSGYGPIAVALAKLSPGARIWAVDVNTRALELTRANADRVGVGNVVAATPDAIPPELRFAAIYSNPPVRVGKVELHAILERWLPRLEPGGLAYLVVQRNLGSDSLETWLVAHGYPARRLKSKKGYRILEVGPPAPAGEP
jgi:16S rRNA (guanine1207-N2)-methyltransferase